MRLIIDCLLIAVVKDAPLDVPLQRKSFFYIQRSAFSSNYITPGVVTCAISGRTIGRHINRFGVHDRLAGALSSRRALLHHALDSRDSYSKAARVLVEALVSSVSTAGPRDHDFDFLYLLIIFCW